MVEVNEIEFEIANDIHEELSDEALDRAEALTICRCNACLWAGSDA